MTKVLRAFHGESSIKARYQARLEEHHRLDQFIRGRYAEGDLEDGSFRGCAVGCTIHSNNHAAYEDELGIPQVLAWLEDGIFEGIPADAAPQFAVDFLATIPVGADLSLVALRFLYWMLMDAEDGVIRFASTDGVVAAVRSAGDLLARSLSGEAITPEQWLIVRDAADAYITDSDVVNDACADESEVAAVETAYFIAVYSLDDALGAAENAATTAVEAEALNIYDVEAGRASAHKKQAAKLLQLLREAPVPK